MHYTASDTRDWITCEKRHLLCRWTFGCLLACAAPLIATLILWVTEAKALFFLLTTTGLLLAQGAVLFTIVFAERIHVAVYFLVHVFQWFCIWWLGCLRIGAGHTDHWRLTILLLALAAAAILIFGK